MHQSLYLSSHARQMNKNIKDVIKNYKKLPYYEGSKIVTKIGQISKYPIKYIVFVGDDQYRLSDEMNASDEMSMFFDYIMDYNTYYINKYKDMNKKYFPRELDLTKEKINEYIQDMIEKIRQDNPTL
ncbi:hypothetical protein CHBEV_098 [Choristoneura biennis entomopoxvirus]|uniref:Uncharacterized protein n=1 Tax=Choristoneura biennis entomopoxvirus TaxID=10288 RepID=A0A916P0W6_CBEPV|nr:hypothetical protein CHBEV_098 [Choristoneura biennis entomopoxvirus]CCU55666.1 hypothetical protein CHBEV_098 [Choristoneura biennis entomopoxvirus]